MLRLSVVCCDLVVFLFFFCLVFFFNDTATTEIYTLSLHDALPICAVAEETTMIVLDASGSMWRQIDGVNKIVNAREVEIGRAHV